MPGQHHRHGTRHALARVLAATLARTTALVLAGSASFAQVATAGKTANAPRPGHIRGTVRLRGAVPVLPPVVTGTGVDACGPTTRPSERLVVGDSGGVANVVVHLPDGGAAVRPAIGPLPVVDQKDCMFIPHVAVVATGSGFLIRNSDPVFHSVHAYTLKGMYTPFNVAMPRQGMEVRLTAGAPGALVLRCDAGHRWMTGYLFVTAGTPATVTRGDGSFSLSVPPGRHRVSIWHELFGEAQVAVEVPPGGTVTLEGTARMEPVPSVSLRVPPGGAR
jgi:hypothetical protein